MNQNKEIEKAVTLLKQGGIVVFPTETVYGIGARLFSQTAIKKIFTIKGRPSDNPLIVHVGDKKELIPLTVDMPPLAEKLIDKFWPGPLTIILKRADIVPPIVTAGLDTVAVRMPQHPVALKLIRELGEPIAAPSANISGRPSPTRFQDVLKELNNKVDYIIDGGTSILGLESTVLDLTHVPPRILRPGFVTLESLKKIDSRITYNSQYRSRGDIPSPGMRHRHYKPSCPVLLVYPKKWNNTIARWVQKNIRIGLITYRQSILQHKSIVFQKTYYGNRNLFAHDLYQNFFEAEKKGVQVLLVESLKREKLGSAIMDRLLRASAK